MSAATTSSLLAGRVPDGLADTAVPDLSLIFDQVAAIRMESQERTIQLRHRYLELMLEGLHDHRAEPLPGSPPTWAEINELLDLAGLASTSSNDPSNSVMRAGCMFRRTNCESPSDSPIMLRTPKRLRTHTVTANGLEFGVLEAGSGPLALCLHGFPDSAHTWRYLLPALADGGFHAVAPFMRGYAPSEIPADGCFQLGALVADAVGLHDALGGDERAVLIGNDWGAETAYGAASFAPDRWRRVVTLAVPPLALDTKIFADYDQLKRFFYLFFLKTPFAESVLAADDMAFLDRLWQDWSPGYDARDDLRNVKQCLREEGNLAAAIGYYRAEEPGLPHSGRDGAYAAEEAAFANAPPQPTLYLHGSRDGCIDPALVKDAQRHLATGSRMKVIEGAGHFLHVEKPALVNDQILAWVTA